MKNNKAAPSIAELFALSQKMNNLCKLCAINPADKKGSHVISLFMVATMLSDENKARDREISLRVSDEKLTEFYIGRDVNPDKIEQLMGRDLTDSEIEKNKNPFVRDYFLCPMCEDKFQRLEDYCSANAYRKLSECKSDENDGLVTRTLSAEQFNGLKLLLLSIVWRASVTRFEKFMLPSSFERKIKILLNSTLTKDAKELTSRLKTSDLSTVNMLTMCHEKTGVTQETNTNFLNFFPYSTTPYYITINEFIVCLYEKKRDLSKQPGKFFGMEKFVKKNAAVAYDHGKIIVIDDVNWKKHRDEILKAIASRKLTHFIKTFSGVYQRILNRLPSKTETQEFTSILVESNEDRLDKYSLSHFAEAAKAFFDKNYPGAQTPIKS